MLRLEFNTKLEFSPKFEIKPHLQETKPLFLDRLSNNENFNV